MIHSTKTCISFFLFILPALLTAQSEAKLLPSIPLESGWFGNSVAIDGQVAIVGAPGNPNIAGNKGVACLFEKKDGSWSQTALFTKPGGKEMDLFGHSVSVSGNIAVVGAPWDDLSYYMNNGSVYVFERGGSGWSKGRPITPGDGRDGHEFGYSVDIDGQTIIVGAVHADNYMGKAYIFVKEGSGWTQQAILKAADGKSAGRFGHSVAIYRDYAVVGQPETPIGGKGAAYLFRRTGSTWAQIAKLEADDGKPLDGFGKSVDIHGAFALIGAPHHDFGNGAEYDEGTAYVFNVPGGNQSAKLRTMEGLDSYAGHFEIGGAVALDGHTAILGALGSGGEPGMTGAAYLFTTGGWSQSGKLLAGDGVEEDFFGIAVAVDDGCPIVGARRVRQPLFESGAAYIFCGAAGQAEPVDVSLGLDVFRPQVLDPRASRVNDAVELSRGAQTFVNLDNDDGDSQFDIQDTNGVSGGDDELVRLVLQIHPPGLQEGKVILEADSGGESIRVWQSNDKTGSIQLPATFDLSTSGLSGFTSQDTALTRSLWVEGIKAHTQPQAARLHLRYEPAGNARCGDPCADTVALTIIGVKTQEWAGRENGFTTDSLSFNNNELDVDPHFPNGEGIPAARRVFPGARAPHFDQPREMTDLMVTLSVAPVEDLSIFVRAFDCDDPSTDQTYVDPNDRPAAGNYTTDRRCRYTEEEDNRDFEKTGFLQGQDSEGMAGLLFPAGRDHASLEFRVSLFPGDNYRLAVNGDRDFLLRLRNRDHDDSFRITDPAVTGSATDREILQAILDGNAAYASDVLTVWRLLHIERDAMLDPPNRGQVLGHITGADPAGTTLTVDIDLHDGSAHLESSAPLFGNSDCDNQDPDQGRFENGSMVLSGGHTFDISGNAADYVTVSGGTDLGSQPIPCVLVDREGLVTSGNAVNLIWENGWTWIIEPQEAPRWNFLENGFLSLDGGTPMEIETSDPGRMAIEVAGLQIPFTLYDDDEVTTLPFANISQLRQSFSDACIQAVLDGGGDPANNKKDIPFIRQMPDSDEAMANLVEEYWQSKDHETPQFWVVYLVSAYEFAPCVAYKGSMRGDGDPDHEQPVSGITPPGGSLHPSLVAHGGDLSFIFFEAERDATASASRRIWRRVDHPTNVAHETGHQFGLHHRQNGLMHSVMRDGTAFSPESLNLIRSRVQSPGW